MRLRWLPIALLLVTGSGLAAVAHGLNALHWPFDLPWTRSGVYRLLFVIAASVATLALAARALRLSAVPAAALIVAVTLTLLGALWPLLIVAAFALASALVGRRLRRWWRDAPPATELLLDIVLGAGVYASLIGVLAHWPVAHSALYAALIALPIVWDRHAALTIVLAVANGARRTTAPFAAWIAATLAIVYAIVALFPELSWDGLAMHLFIPGHVAAHRMWSFDPERFSWALMPALGDWLFAIVYLLDGERGVRVLNAGCSLLLAALVHRLAELGGASRGWSWFAAALWLATPVVFAVSASSFIDAEWTLFVLAGVYALLLPGVPGQPPYRWITAGALLGCAAAAKAVTLPMLPVIALMALAGRDTLRVRGSVQVLLWAALAFVVIGGKPYATAWALTGNPVYPFYVGIFGGPAFEFWSDGPQHFRRPLSWTTLYDATFATQGYIEGRTGAAGFQWLLLLPAAALALVATRHRRGLLLLVTGVAMLVAIFVFQSYLRYVLPALGLLVAAIGVAATAARELRGSNGVVLGAAGAIALGLNVAYLNATSTYIGFPIEVVASEQARQDHIAQTLPIRRAAELAAQLPDAGRIAFFSQPAFASASHADVVNMSWYTPRFLRAIREAGSTEALTRTLLDWNVRYVLTDEWWNEPQVRRRLESATVPLVDFHGAAIREVRRDFAFEQEYLQNAELSAPTGWHLVGSAKYDAERRVLIVTAESPAYQLVRTRPGTAYRNTVRARCTGSATARVQVNWLDASEKFISTSLQSFACGEAWTEKTQEVVAPRDAAMAVVYATGGASAPVEIGAVSLRGRKP